MTTIGITSGGLKPNAAAFINSTFDPNTLSMANLDVSDPDSLFAFFHAQSTEAQNGLKAMMVDQQTRNEKVQALQTANAKFVQWESSGVDPSDPGFRAAAEELKNILPPGQEKQNIEALLNQKGPEKQQYFTPAPMVLDSDRKKMAEEFARQNGGTVVELPPDPMGLKTYEVKWNDKAPNLSGDQVKTITASIKSLSDGMQSDTSMAMIRIQQGVERMSQITNLCSNILKKLGDAQDTVIGNLR